jgi:hypothetical protein
VLNLTRLGAISLRGAGPEGYCQKCVGTRSTTWAHSRSLRPLAMKRNTVPSDAEGSAHANRPLRLRSSAQRIAEAVTCGVFRVTR